MTAPNPAGTAVARRPRWRLPRVRALTRAPALARAAGLALRVFGALTLCSLIYRLRIYLAVFAEDPAGLATGRRQWSRLLGFALGDLLVALLVASLALGSLLLWSSLRRVVPRAMTRIVPVIGWALLALLLLVVGIVCQSHHAALLAMGTGLTVNLLAEAASNGASGIPSLLALLGAGDVALILAPLLAFGLLQWIPTLRASRPVRLVLGGALALGAAAILAAAAVAATSGRLPAPVHRCVAQNPVAFLARDLALHLASVDDDDWPRLLPRPAEGTLLALRVARDRVRERRDQPLQTANDAFGAAPDPKPWRGQVPFASQLTSVQLVHPSLVSSVVPKKTLPAHRSARQWNVVFVLMESTGLRYVFDRSAYPKAPMPFVERLASQGLNLTDHYSPSNSSPRSIFALLSGLNPMPELRIFSMSKGLRFPSLFTLLPRQYDTFMVTPASLKWYFPHDFIKHSGPAEVHDYHNLPVKRRVPGKAIARHEVDTVDFFLQRLDRARVRPFFAVYYSFVAHWPYPDFGERYQRFPPARKVNRYLNNLYLLDTQIERIHGHLEKRGLLESTILVLVGDHGEAFGQHKGNWTHSRHSFNENYQTPAVLWQPRLFAPSRVTQPTTHADFAPTLLDAMGVAYNPRLFQGESLFQDALRRRYVFLFGNENVLSSISTDGVKLQLSFRQRKCWVYDLRSDPDERRRLDCKQQAYDRQYRATVYYQRYQARLLRAYNEACRANETFYGQRHPGVATAGQ